MTRAKYKRINIKNICVNNDISKDTTDILLKKFLEGTIKTEYLKSISNEINKQVYAIKLNHKARCFALLENDTIIVIQEDLEHKFDVEKIKHAVQSYVQSDKKVEFSSSSAQGAIIDDKLIIYNQEQLNILDEYIKSSEPIATDSEYSSSTSKTFTSYSDSSVSVNIVNGMPGSGKTIVGYDIIAKAKADGKQPFYITKSSALVYRAHKLFMTESRERDSSDSDDESDTTSTTATSSTTSTTSVTTDASNPIAITYEHFAVDEIFKYLEEFLQEKSQKKKKASQGEIPSQDDIIKCFLGQGQIIPNEVSKNLLSEYKTKHVATFNNFEKWAKEKKILGALEIESYQDCYKEMQKTCLKDIGRKSTQYVDKHKSGAINKILDDYKSHLKTTKLVDISLLESSKHLSTSHDSDSTESQDVVVVIDEAQNFSPSELSYVLAKFPKNATIYIFKHGDQSLVDPYNITDSTINSYYDGKVNISEYQLTTSHRAPESIISFGQKILDTKNALLFGNKGIEKYNPNKDEGYVGFFNQEDFLSQDSLSTMIQDFINTVIICFSNDLKTDAKKYFPNSLILLPDEVIGLEYTNVILFNPFNFDKSIKSKVLTKLSDITASGASSAGEYSSSKTSSYNLKNEEDLDLVLPLNRLYVACTRSTKNLYVLNTTKGSPLESVFSKLLNPSVSAAPNTQDIGAVQYTESELSLEDAVRHIQSLTENTEALKSTISLLIGKLDKYRESNQYKAEQLKQLLSLNLSRETSNSLESKITFLETASSSLSVLESSASSKTLVTPFADKVTKKASATTPPKIHTPPQKTASDTTASAAVSTKKAGINTNHKKLESIDSYYKRGWVHNNKGNIEEAIKAFQQVVLLDGNHYKAWYNLGILYEKKGNTEEAIKAFQQVVLLDGNHYKAWYDLGVLYTRKGNTDKAIEAYEKTTKLDGNHSHSWRNVGVLYAKNGNTEKAIEAFEQVVRLDGNHCDTLYNLGVLYAKNGNTEKAIKAFEKTTKLGLNNYGVWNKLSELHEKNGNADKAIKAFENALKLDPKNIDTLRKLQELKQDISETAKSDQESEQALDLQQKIPEIVPSVDTVGESSLLDE